MEAAWDHKLYFPTRVVTKHSGDEVMVEGLREMFRAEKKYSSKYFEKIADLEDMMDHSNQYPVLTKLKEFMWDGMLSWLKAEGIQGEFGVQTHVFPNYGKKGAYVPAHNHQAQVSGVYYVDIPDVNEKQDLFVQEDTKRYWALDPGVLILHDPRGNASLAELSEKNYVKFFPRPGMGIIFPSYLWHSVTPHQSEKDRISIAFNFTIISKEERGMAVEPLKL